MASPFASCVVKRVPHVFRVSHMVGLLSPRQVATRLQEDDRTLQAPLASPERWQDQRREPLHWENSGVKS